ncbi:unnamed protein product [Urochloa humidicola]
MIEPVCEGSGEFGHQRSRTHLWRHLLLPGGMEKDLMWCLCIRIGRASPGLATAVAEGGTTCHKLRQRYGLQNHQVLSF